MKKWLLVALLVGFTVNQAEAKIERSEKAKNSFKLSHPCPANGNTSGACPGYVIDHIKALACGGADDPSNMQWQTEAEGKAKDKWELKDCQVNNPITPPVNGNYHIGPKGGCYTLSGGKKQYVDHSFCGR